MREDQDNYLEAVVVKKELEKLTARLEKFLGSAISPSKLPKQLVRTLKEFGGIRAGQTLYFKEGEGSTVIAILWPWNDKEHTTVKIINQE